MTWLLGDASMFVTSPARRSGSDIYLLPPEVKSEFTSPETRSKAEELFSYTLTVCWATAYQSVHPSVCLSVCRLTFRYRDHIGWNSSKTISWPNSLKYLLTMTPTWAIWSNGNIPIIRVE